MCVQRICNLAQTSTGVALLELQIEDVEVALVADMDIVDI